MGGSGSHYKGIRCVLGEHDQLPVCELRISDLVLLLMCVCSLPNGGDSGGGEGGRSGLLDVVVSSSRGLGGGGGGAGGPGGGWEEGPAAGGGGAGGGGSGGAGGEECAGREPARRGAPALDEAKAAAVGARAPQCSRPGPCPGRCPGPRPSPRPEGLTPSPTASV